MRATDLINNGKFNYGAFNDIPKYKQDVLIVPYKNFLERYGGFKFTFSDRGLKFPMSFSSSSSNGGVSAILFLLIR